MESKKPKRSRTEIRNSMIIEWIKRKAETSAEGKTTLADALEEKKCFCSE